MSAILLKPYKYHIFFNSVIIAEMPVCGVLAFSPWQIYFILSICHINYSTFASSVSSGFEVVRSLRFKVLWLIMLLNKNNLITLKT